MTYCYWLASIVLRRALATTGPILTFGMWYLLGKETRNCKKKIYNPHHIIIDRFAAKVGEPWILQTNLTECFFFYKNTMWQDKFYIEKKQTQKRKKKRKRKKKYPHLYIIHTSVYMHYNGKKIVEIIITIIIFVVNKNKVRQYNLQGI